jgi:hypothetical protein
MGPAGAENAGDIDRHICLSRLGLKNNIFSFQLLSQDFQARLVPLRAGALDLPTLSAINIASRG